MARTATPTRVGPQHRGARVRRLAHEPVDGGHRALVEDTGDLVEQDQAGRAGGRPGRPAPCARCPGTDGPAPTSSPGRHVRAVRRAPVARRSRRVRVEAAHAGRGAAGSSGRSSAAGGVNRSGTSADPGRPQGDAVRRRDQPGRDAQQRRLAAAVGTAHRDDLAGLDLQGHVAKDGCRPPVALPDAGAAGSPVGASGRDTPASVAAARGARPQCW